LLDYFGNWQLTILVNHHKAYNRRFTDNMSSVVDVTSGGLATNATVDNDTVDNDGSTAANTPSLQQQQQQQSSDRPAFLTFHNGSLPIYYHNDWHVGLGGGLWSTGAAMAHYLTTRHAYKQIQKIWQRKGKQGLRLVELGSGNGLLATCWWAMGRDYLDCLVVTDMADHLDRIRETLAENDHLHHVKSTASSTAQPPSKVNIHVMVLDWGVSFAETSVSTANVNSDKDDTDTGTSTSTAKGYTTDELSTYWKTHACLPFDADILVGSDVVYHEDLYDPFIKTLSRLSSSHTVTLLGVTMVDTTPTFFDMLNKAGFVYERIQDALMDVSFRGNTFGLFVVQKKQSLW
jgi:predicted nicotinamide N-methyase